DAAIVGIGEGFEAAALTVATLKELGVPRIYARAESEIQGKIMLKVGADAVVSPHRESAARWAHRLMLPSLEQYVELGEGYSLIYAPAPTAFHHQTLMALKLRREYGVNLVAIKRKVPCAGDQGAPAKDADQDGASPVEESVISVPNADTTILPDDILILVGSDEALSNLPAD
ncbi:MAG: TrkA family potassium uptake protein, partial [bacterium]|nr:TrkA family potassium uptake protein [bacterium]